MSKKKILYAEDEIDLQELVSIELEAELEMDVVTVKDGAEAIDVLKKDVDKEICMVVSDYSMHPMDGGFI
jgi:CheY-like chemotaxis protein